MLDVALDLELAKALELAKLEKVLELAKLEKVLEMAKLQKVLEMARQVAQSPTREKVGAH